MNSVLKKLSAKQAKSMIRKINKFDDTIEYNENHTQILVWDMPFASNAVFIECADYSIMPHCNKNYLDIDKSIKKVVYTDNPYNDNNLQTLDLHLDKDNIAYYLRFYMDLFQNKMGVLTPVHSHNDINLQEDISPSLLNILSTEFQNYPIIESKNTDFSVKLICVFKQALFEVTFDVSAQGQVIIGDRKILLNDLPIKNLS